MTLQDHVNKQAATTDTTRQVLLAAITEATEEAKRLNPGGQATALKDLAEAYAWVAHPSNAH